MHGDAELYPVASATTIRVRNGKMLTMDGPFAETKEQRGGYYFTDVPNLDEAPTWAAKIPSAANGSIEVRPPAPHESYCTHMMLASAVRAKIVHAKKIAKAKTHMKITQRMRFLSELVLPMLLFIWCSTKVIPSPKMTH